MSSTEIVGLLGGFAAILTVLWKFQKIEKSAEASAARCAKLEKELRQSAENEAHTIKALRDYYDAKIEGQEKEVENLIHRVAVAEVAYEFAEKTIKSMCLNLGEKLDAYEKTKQNPN